MTREDRMIWTRVHREHLKEYPEQFDPVPPVKTLMNELKRLYIGKFRLRNATNNKRIFIP